MHHAVFSFQVCFGSVKLPQQEMSKSSLKGLKIRQPVIRCEHHLNNTRFRNRPLLPKHSSFLKQNYLLHVIKSTFRAGSISTTKITRKIRKVQWLRITVRQSKERRKKNNNNISTQPRAVVYALLRLPAIPCVNKPRPVSQAARKAPATGRQMRGKKKRRARWEELVMSCPLAAAYVTVHSTLSWVGAVFTVGRDGLKARSRRCCRPSTQRYPKQLDLQVVADFQAHCRTIPQQIQHRPDLVQQTTGLQRNFLTFYTDWLPTYKQRGYIR